MFDIQAEWARKGTDVRGATVPGGHLFPELAPEETAAVLAEFLSRTAASSLADA